MTGFLLDTNVPSELIRSQPDPRVDSWFREQDDEQLYLSVVTIGELRKGVTLLPDSKRRTRLEDWIERDLLPAFSGRVLPVTQEISDRWGRVSGMRMLSGRPLSMADGLIAATALEHRLTLVTRNEKDYVDLGLDVLNPWGL